MGASKRTPENRAKLIELRGMGLSLNKCYEAIGVGKTMGTEWRKDDPELEEALEAAFAGFIQRQHENVVNDAKENARSAQWLLERLAPEDYSETQRTEHTFVLEMPGLLQARTPKAQAWLSGAKDEDWKALDERAAAGELTDADYELLEEPGDDA